MRVSSFLGCLAVALVAASATKAMGADDDVLLPVRSWDGGTADGWAEEALVETTKEEIEVRLPGRSELVKEVRVLHRIHEGKRLFAQAVLYEARSGLAAHRLAQGKIGDLEEYGDVLEREEERGVRGGFPGRTTRARLKDGSVDHVLVQVGPAAHYVLLLVLGGPQAPDAEPAGRLFQAIRAKVLEKVAPVPKETLLGGWRLSS